MKSRKLIWLVVVLLLAITLSSCNLGATPVPTEDPGIIQTQAFNIVSTQAAMQQTQTALAIPPTQAPTNTLLPTATLVVAPTFGPIGGSTPFAFNTQPSGLTPLASLVPTSGIVSTLTTKNGCNDGLYQSEAGVADGTVLTPSKKFAKSWDIKNTGTCAWDEGYAFVFMSDLSTSGFKGYDIVLKKNRPEDYTKPGSSQNFVLKLTAPTNPGEYIGYWKMKDDAGNFFGPLVYVKIVVK